MRNCERDKTGVCPLAEKSKATFLGKSPTNDRAPAAGSVADKLRGLSESMVNVACELDYFGGFNERWIEKSKELRGAACIAGEWADELDKQR